MPGQPPVGQPGGQEAGEAGRLGDAVDALEPGGPSPAQGRQHLGQHVVTDRDAGGVSRVGQGVAGIEAVAGLDPDASRPRTGVEDDLGGEGELGPELGGHGPGNDVVPGQSGISASGEADQAATLAGAEVAEGGREPRMGVECGAGVGRADRGVGDEQVEQVAGDDQRAGTAPRLDGAGQVGRGRGRGGRGHGPQQQVAHHEHPATEPDLDIELVRKGGGGGERHRQPSWQWWPVDPINRPIVLRSMAEATTPLGVPDNWRWAAEPVPPGSAVVFDLDGVLSDAASRQHFLESPRRDWNAFFDACGEDPLIEEVDRLLDLLDPALAIILVTARPIRVQPQTLAWLERYRMRWDLLVMRELGDYASAPRFKHQAVSDLRAYGFRLLLAFEDDRRNLEMFRGEGVPCLYIHSGYYD